MSAKTQPESYISLYVHNSNLVPGTKKSANTHHKGTFSDEKTKPGVKTVYGKKAKKTYRKRFMRRNAPYKLPTICRCEDGDWYIQFAYEYPDKPGKFKYFKVRDGINRYHDIADKEYEAQSLLRDVAYWLEKLDYNPFEQEKNVIKQVHKEAIERAGPKNWTVTDAIAEFRKFVIKQNYSPRTINTYNNYLFNLENYLKENADKNIDACEFSEVDLITFLDTECDELGWSARTYNNYLEFYSTFFNRCFKLEKQQKRKIAYNFDISGIDTKKTSPQKNKAYSAVLFKLVKKELSKPGKENLRDYIEWIFLSMMRPAEIQALQVKDIDEDNRQIRIIGKTGDRLIPISDQLQRLIKKRGVMKLNHNAYVFGAGGRPGLNRMSKNYFPEKYVELKKDLNLEGNYTLYGFKHTAVVNMITAGFTDEQIMVLSGHKTKDAFNAYKRDLIIDTSHVMKSNAIEF